MLLDAARILRRRKFEFDAWLVYEAGKTWPEAEADVSEAIDFCEYYAREMERLARPAAGGATARRARRDALPAAGRGRGDSAMEFPAGDSGGHDGGLAGDRQHRGHQAVERDADHRRQVRRGAAGSRLPATSLHACCTGSGAAVGDVLVQHPKTRFVVLHRLARRGPAHQRTGRQAAAGPDLDQARDRRNGRQGRHHRGWRCDLDKAVDGVLASAFGYQGQKCSACSRAIVDATVYDEFLEKLAAKAKQLTVGPSDDPANYMGPVISEGARKTILNYIEIGQEGRPPGGRRRRRRRATATSSRRR